jgi:hypothetical protein
MGHGWVFLDENYVKSCQNGRMKKTLVASICKQNQIQEIVA